MISKVAERIAGSFGLSFIVVLHTTPNLFAFEVPRASRHRFLLAGNIRSQGDEIWSRSSCLVGGACRPIDRVSATSGSGGHATPWMKTDTVR